MNTQMHPSNTDLTFPVQTNYPAYNKAICDSTRWPFSINSKYGRCTQARNRSNNSSGLIARISHNSQSQTYSLSFYGKRELSCSELLAKSNS